MNDTDHIHRLEQAIRDLIKRFDPASPMFSSEDARVIQRARDLLPESYYHSPGGTSTETWDTRGGY